MAGPTFDAKSTLRFDLGRGIVTHKSAARQVLLPAESVLALLTAAGEAAAQGVGKQLGSAIGASLLQAFGSSERVGDATLAELTEGLALEISVRGLGLASFESYGDALVVRIDEPVIASSALWEPLLAAALREAAAVDVAVVKVAAEPLRLLVASSATAGRARNLSRGDKPLSELLSQLQESKG